MVGLFSENPFVGYCLLKPAYDTFNLDFSLPNSFTAHKYVLQSFLSMPNTNCLWSYPVSWNIYYGDNFSNLTLLASEKDNTILSTRGVSFEFKIKPFKASVIRFQMVKANDNRNYFGLSQFDFFGDIGSGIKVCKSIFCIATNFYVNMLLFFSDIVIS